MEFPYMLGAAILAISFLAALGWGKKTQTRPFTQYANENKQGFKSIHFFPPYEIAKSLRIPGGF